MPQDSTPTNKLCRVCASPLPSHRWVFCAHECELVYRREVAGRPESTPSTATVGALHELLVAIELMRRGWHVFRALSPACPCDLVVYQDPDTIIRIQVRTASRRPRGGVYASLKKSDVGQHDVLALVTHDGEILFDPDILS